MTQPLTLPSPLVDTDWLAQRLDHPDLRIVDASFYLPHLRKTFDEEFAAARIPGARPFNVDLISRTDTDLPHMLPEPESFGRAVSELGIGSDHTVVAYDTIGLFSAARAWWMFRTFGHDSVAVLDGGLPAWQSAGYRIESGPAGVWPPAAFSPLLKPDMVKSIDIVRDVTIRKDMQVVDARPADRFSGEVAEFREGVRSGHIPGSLNLPFMDLFDPETGLLKRGSALIETLEDAGIDRSRPVIASCGSGVTACLVDLALIMSGDEGASIYDGSWTEWGSRHDLPIAMGKNMSNTSRE